MGWFSRRKNKKKKEKAHYPETIKYDCYGVSKRQYDYYRKNNLKMTEMPHEEVLRDWNLCIATGFLQEVEFEKGEYTILEENFAIGSNPYFICKMEDVKKCFVYVKYGDASNFSPEISPSERINAIDQALAHRAVPYYVPIGVSHSIDNKLGFNAQHQYVFINNYGVNKIERKPQEWIDATLAEINKLEPEPVNDVRYSLDVDTSGYHDWDRKNTVKTFQEQLMTYIDEKGLSNNEFYKAAYIDRKLFSAIKNNTYYKPKKQTAVACCFGLKLGIDESEELLKLAGYSFSLAIKWDKIVYYCLKNEIYDINDVNDLLYEEGENCF